MSTKSKNRITKYRRDVRIIIRLQELGLRYYKVKCKSYINQTNMKGRLAFAKKICKCANVILEEIMWRKKGLCVEKKHMKHTKSRSLGQLSN